MDNADDPQLVRGLAKYLPFSRQGSILVITRNRGIARTLDVMPKDTITVPAMDDNEAVEMLQTNIRQDQVCDIETTKQLLEVLTYLPLAIKQASAFIFETGCTVSRYLHICQSSDKNFIQLLSENYEDRHRSEDDAQDLNPVATTWWISFQHILRSDYRALASLSCICFLAEKDIPLALFPKFSAIETLKAIGTLQAYAFITKSNTPDTFDMHRLVRLVWRNWLRNENVWDHASILALHCLAENYPFPTYENREAWTRYLPHGQALLDSVVITTENGMVLVDSIAESYARLQRHSQAKILFQEAIQIGERLLGKTDLTTLRIRSNLSNVLLYEEKYEEAEKMVREILEARMEILGVDHPVTLQSFRNLALSLSKQGKYREAEKMHRKTLELGEKILDKGDLDLFRSKDNLGECLFAQEKFEEADHLIQRTLKEKRYILGADHLITVLSMENAAAVLSHFKRYEEAEPLYRQVLQARRKSKEDGRILSATRNLAHCLADQKKYDEAEQLYRQAIETVRKLPDEGYGNITVQTMQDLAMTLFEHEKYGEAEGIQRQVLETQLKAKGGGYPETVDSARNLGLILHRGLKTQEATDIYRQILDLSEKAHGKEHPDTLRSINDLADYLRIQKQWEEAGKYHRQALDLGTKLKGKESRETLQSLKHLVYCLRNQEKYDEGELYAREAIHVGDKLHGQEHPDTIHSTGELAFFSCLTK